MIGVNEITKNTSFLIPVIVTIGLLLFLIIPTVNFTYVDNLFIFVNAQPQTLGNNTSVSVPSSMLPSSTRNDSMHLCNDPTNGFSILYPSNWTRRPDECTIFGPAWGQIFADNAQTYVRISVSNTSYPNMTIRDLEHDNTQFFPEISFKPDKDNPSSIFGLKINGSDAYARYYKWTGSPYEGLPYVNQFLDLPLSPTITTAQPTTNATIAGLPTTNTVTGLPTTNATITTAQPTTNATITTAQPTTNIPITTAQPTTNIPITTAQPTTNIPITTAQPTTNATITGLPTNTTGLPVTNATITTAQPTTNATITGSLPTNTTGLPVTNTPSTTAQPTQNTTADTEFPNKLYAIYTIKNDKVYVIEYNAPTEEIWDHYLPEVKKMIESFVFNSSQP
jgi:hypothetical protein